MTSYSSARALTSCIGKTLTECDVYMVSSHRVLYISNVRVRHAQSHEDGCEGLNWPRPFILRKPIRVGAHRLASNQSTPTSPLFLPPPLVSTTTLRYVHILSPVYTSLKYYRMPYSLPDMFNGASPPIRRSHSSSDPLLHTSRVRSSYGTSLTRNMLPYGLH